MGLVSQKVEEKGAGDILKLKFTVFNTRAVFTLAVIAIAVLILSGCEKEKPESSFSVTPETPHQTFTKPHIVVTERGMPSTIIDADTVTVHEDKNHTILKKNVKIQFFDNDGQHSTTLTSSIGEIWGLYDAVDSLTASGDVRMESHVNGSVIETEVLLWKNSDRRIRAEGEVLLKTDRGYERGTGFEAKDDLTEYRFTGPVRGEISGSEIPDYR